MRRFIGLVGSFGQPVIRTMAIAGLGSAPLAAAYDINDQLSLEATLTGVYQYADFSKRSAPKDTGRGALVLDLAIGFKPTENDSFNIVLSAAAGNSLNGVEAFTLRPFGDDLEDDYQDINGRNRDYLLEAWYKHVFQFSEETNLGATVGIIDNTAYIDHNAYANDETSQFMNEVFVNNPLANLPSYDIGGALEFKAADMTLNGVVMNTGNDTRDEYTYYALQLGYTIRPALGEGNYRIYGFMTDKEFTAADGSGRERLQGFGLSLDQALGETVGVFARFGWQDDAAEVDHDTLYSAGAQFSGKLWGRENDAAGLAFAYLEGVDGGEVNNTYALEGYVKVELSSFSDLSFDIQYIEDQIEEGEDQEGWIYGIRVNGYF